MTIKNLKLMNETDRILWFASAKSSDLTLVLKNEGIKGLSKLKKAEKLEMIVGMVVEDNVTDDAIDKVVEDTKKLTEELNVRQSYEEEFEATLYARLCAKEITWLEFKQTVVKRNISIPINVADEEYTKDLLDRKCDLYSEYEHYVYKGDTYYSVLNKDFEWREVFKNNGKYRWKNWHEKQFYERNTVDKDGVLQLAFDYDENDYYTVLVYKNHELLGAYKDGNIDDIKKLVEYDYRLAEEDIDAYEELLALLEKQHEEYNRIMEADRILRKKLKNQYKYKKFSSFANENPKRRY